MQYFKCKLSILGFKTDPISKKKFFYCPLGNIRVFWELLFACSFCFFSSPARAEIGAFIKENTCLASESKTARSQVGPWDISWPF